MSALAFLRMAENAAITTSVREDADSILAPTVMELFQQMRRCEDRTLHATIVVAIIGSQDIVFGEIDR